MKSKLRLHAKSKILEIANKSHKALLLIQKLYKLKKIAAATSFLIYSPTKFEVDIAKFKLKLFLDNKIVYFPFIELNKVGLVKSDGDMKMNDRFNISEPKKASDINSKNKIEIAIIPGLSFDKKGYRLGYGSGWYDRFLSKHPEILKIGVCFDEMLVDELPNEEHDVRMDIIVTDLKIIQL